MAFKHVFQFQIKLLGIEPSIWRRIQVPEDYTFWDLHVALQDAMGWFDYHLHEFRLDYKDAKAIQIGIPDDEGLDLYKDTFAGWEVPIKQYFLKSGDSAQYDYDFGDDWQHELMLEDILVKTPRGRYPKCIDGYGACPPEDCGGIWGYEELLEVLEDPRHDQYEDMKMWLSNHVKNYWPYEPERFDAKQVKFDNPHERWLMAFSDDDE